MRPHPTKPPRVADVIAHTYRRHWAMLSFGLLALLLGQGGAILIPKVTGIAVDRIRELGSVVGKRGEGDIFAGAVVDLLGLEAADGDAVLRCLLGLALATLAVCVLQYFKRLYLTGLSRHYEFEMREALFGKLQMLRRDVSHRVRSGDVISRATSDIEATRMMFGPALMYIAETLVLLPLALTAMYYVSPEMMLWASLPLALVVVLTLYYTPRQREQSRIVQERQADLSARAQENFSGTRVVKAFGRERFESESFDKLSCDLLDAQLRLARTRQAYQALLATLPSIGIVLVLVVGSRHVASGVEARITLGEMLEFIFYFALLAWPMMAIGWITSLISRGVESKKRIDELLNEAIDRSVTSAGEGKPFDRSVVATIEFDNVSFSYDAARPAIERASFAVPAGTTLGIVGAVGAGKSTIANLLLRLDEPESGVIRIGGEDIRNYDPATLREGIGYVPQETFLYSETVGYNVAFGVADAMHADIESATARAGMAEEVEALPKRYDTMLGERGVNLSGGQKQRLAIARALIKQPRIVVLDDCLSSVDTKTEARILDALKSQLAGSTAIMIAQRVSTIAHADQIIVLDHGRIVECGTHAELVGKGGLYATLAAQQETQATK